MACSLHITHAEATPLCARLFAAGRAKRFRVHPVCHKFSFWATGLVYQKVGIVTMI